MNPKILKEMIVKNNPEQGWIAHNLMLWHFHGSLLYGTNGIHSDTDIRGIVLAPKDYWVGAHKFEQIEIKQDGLDIVIYDVRKWLNLVYYNNPSVIESLFVPDHTIIHASEHWNYLRDEARKLLSKQAHTAFSGYAHAQWKKLFTKYHNKTGRQEIVDEHGFDTKFASHGFRLCRQGCELLKTGHITLPRPEAEFLKDVRSGMVYGKEDMMKCIDDLEKEKQELDVAFTESILPDKGDFKLYNNLLMEVFSWLN
jgi:hypothetical protein